jgi:hypothetical protein
MSSRPIRFYFPAPRVDRGAQTPLIFTTEPTREPILSRLRSSAVHAIISQDPRPTGQRELSYLLEFNSGLVFFLATHVDERFDLLTPPDNIFQDFPLGFCANFHNELLHLTSADGDKEVTFPYGQICLPIIDSLETGIVSAGLIGLLRKQLAVDPAAWEDGHILCAITDFRVDPPAEFSQMLHVSNGAVGYCEKKHKGASPVQTLEGEREILKILRPTVCLDASPDVARVQSIIDWRMKLWRRARRLANAEMEVAQPMIRQKEVPQDVILAPLKGPVVIPESIFHVFTAMPNGIKA